MVDELQGVRPPGRRRGGDWVIRIVSSIRLFVVLAVLGTFLSAVTLYVYGTLAVVKVIWDTAVHGELSVDGARELQVSFVELTDVFLLGTVLVVVAVGLYQLFLRADLPLPAWLRIHTLDQLTAKLIEVIGVLLGVTFLALVFDAGAGADILDAGLAVAVVIVALSLLLIVSHRIGGGSGPPRAG
jgi:uncharacterized membrane protein YqhA